MFGSDLKYKHPHTHKHTTEWLPCTTEYLVFTEFRFSAPRGTAHLCVPAFVPSVEPVLVALLAMLTPCASHTCVCVFGVLPLRVDCGARRRCQHCQRETWHEQTRQEGSVRPASRVGGTDCKHEEDANGRTVDLQFSATTSDRRLIMFDSVPAFLAISLTRSPTVYEGSAFLSRCSGCHLQTAAYICLITPLI